MARSITVLELPVQLFVAGSAAGMLFATIHYHRTGELDRAPIFVAYFALAGFGIGLLASLLSELT